MYKGYKLIQHGYISISIYVCLFVCFHRTFWLLEEWCGICAYVCGLCGDCLHKHTRATFSYSYINFFSIGEQINYMISRNKATECWRKLMAVSARICVSLCVRLCFFFHFYFTDTNICSQRKHENIKFMMSFFFIYLICILSFTFLRLVLYVCVCVVCVVYNIYWYPLD